MLFKHFDKRYSFKQPTPSKNMNKERQVKIIAILAIIFGTLTVLRTFYEFSTELSQYIGWLALLLAVLVSAIPSLIVIGGIGILKYKNWGRQIILTISVLVLITLPYQVTAISLTLAFGGLRLLNILVPLITLIIAIWSLIVLFNKEVKSLFT